MKYFVRIVTTIILLIVTCFFVTEYAVGENIKVGQISCEQYINLNSKNEAIEENIQQEDDKLDIFEILENHKKYTTEYEAANGEKYTVLGIIKIPKIGVEHDIFSTTSDALLDMSVNRYWGPNPNEVGNMCIVGHNFNDSKFFANLYKLNIGDTVEIEDAYGRVFNYNIYDKFVVDPYDTSCTSQLTNGETEITLITCHDFGRTRLILKARTEEIKTNSIISNFISKIFE